VSTQDLRPVSEIEAIIVPDTPEGHRFIDTIRRILADADIAQAS
jgi:hypothetical protein